MWSSLDDYPQTKGIVRMNVPIGGVHYQPFKDDPNKCSVVSIMECDLGGNIPYWIQ